MTIFQQVQEIIARLKRETRRLWNEGDYGWIIGEIDRGGDRPRPLYSEVFNAKGRRRFYVGQLLPIVPKRGKPAIRDAQGCIQYVRVTQIFAEPLQCLTDEDARAEGVADREAYIALWQRINGKKRGARWEDNPRVLVVRFEFVGAK